MKAFVYILQSFKNEKYYVGSTIDVERRLKEHNSGKVYSTKRFMPFKLVFFQECVSITIAQQVERRIKNFKRRDFIEKIIQEGRIRKV